MFLRYVGKLAGLFPENPLGALKARQGKIERAVTLQLFGSFFGDHCAFSVVLFWPSHLKYKVHFPVDNQ